MQLQWEATLSVPPGTSIHYARGPRATSESRPGEPYSLKDPSTLVSSSPVIPVRSFAGDSKSPLFKACLYFGWRSTSFPWGLKTDKMSTLGWPCWREP